MTTSPLDETEPDRRAFRLAPRGRAAVSDFTPEERLFRRCLVSDLDPADSERLFPNSISFYPDWSVNRGDFSEPEDVLYPDYLGWGIAAFQVKDIPSPMKTEGNIPYHWDAQHQPLDENYSHTEIWTYKGGTHLANPKAETDPKPPDLPKTVKKYFRTVLSERARIICAPRTPPGL